MDRTQRLNALQTSRLYLCTDARTEQGDLREFLHACFAGGVDIIQLRDKKIEARAEISALEVLAEVAAEHGCMFAVNDRADIARIVGADVFHVGQGDLSPTQARTILGPDVIMGRSNNSVAQFTDSLADPELDYAVIGPVWPTPTKPGRPAVGLDVVREVATLIDAHPAPKPWFAIGGISTETVSDVLDAGASRIVVVRALTHATDPEEVAGLLREKVATHGN
ncbi:thiamine phosphate synthase [Corynebacterium epidermidicanis]|uniref:Thiamine-phosphate synthase n=1 Tax=Corynebacterium epidermidicanis TaxID=1050174 RepID=A0A0G3GSZ2_9CORY|nr:thiamine phosphate synthase [Corynebacterium epidermidicanis]AKK04301.1 thiamine-phosphate diphosphorylase [Corynebacterium epidermidicanis]